MGTFNIISCVDEKLGIGKNGNIPWYIKDDMEYFKNMTMNSIVIMGNSTFISINRKPLRNRINIIFSICKKPNIPKKLSNKDMNKVYIINDISQFWEIETDKNINIFVIGGEKIYRLFINYFTIHKIQYNLYLTQILNKSFDCDVFFPDIPNNLILTYYSEKKHFDNLDFRFLKYTTTFNDHQEFKYLNLLKEITLSGEIKENRTGIETYSIFGKQIRFDISNEIPLLTTKKLVWKKCIEELLWFLRGETDVKVLQEKDIHVWDGNSTREFLDKRGLYYLPTGIIGESYGHQFRHFGGNYDPVYARDTWKYKNKIGGVDQIEYVINELKYNKTSRGILINLWNPNSLYKQSIFCCHIMLQLYVNNKNELSGHMYQRSVDTFLGFPWNIFSYSVLIYILAKLTDLKPKELIISTGDTHIYTNHIEQVCKQLSRSPRPFPSLIVSDNIKNKEIHEINIDDFEIISYHPHPFIKASMAI